MRRALHVTVLATVLLSGCATGPSRQDPFESYNRGMFKFNQDVDEAVFKPVAKGYNAVLPQAVRQRITNFFSNINDVVVLVNDLLQFKIEHALSDFWRIVVNTTVGLAGIHDVANDMGLQKRIEDFGQTLGYWGFESGPYVVLPFLGPSSVRDGIGLVGDFYASPLSYADDSTTGWVLWGTRVIQVRADLLATETERLLGEAALDRYSFIRDAYLQRRRSLVYDGNPPREKLEDFNNDEPSAGQPRSSIPDALPVAAGIAAPAPIPPSFGCHAPGQDCDPLK